MTIERKKKLSKKLEYTIQNNQYRCCSLRHDTHRKVMTVEIRSQKQCSCGARRSGTSSGWDESSGRVEVAKVIQLKNSHMKMKHET